MIPVFDGHTDFVLRLDAASASRIAIWTDGDGSGHIDLPRLRRGR